MHFPPRPKPAVAASRLAAPIAAVLMIVLLAGSSNSSEAPANAQMSMFERHLLRPIADEVPVPVRQQHAFGMNAYRQLAEQSSSANVGLPMLNDSINLGPWFWFSSDWNSIRRLADGTFLITLLTLNAQLQRDIRCQVGEWPILNCNDEVTRRMSAPSPELLILDGDQYVRHL